MKAASNADMQTLKKKLAGWRVSRSDRKAWSYVGAFFDRQRRGLKIVAKVEGNHGTYTVSIDASRPEEESACSCYIGKYGGCHHCRALAQTFLDEPESFIPQKTKTRKSIRSVEDIPAFLNGITLEQIIADLQERGMTQKKLAEILGMNYQLLGSAKRSEQRNRFFGFLVALKLAGLFILDELNKDRTS